MPRLDDNYNDQKMESHKPAIGNYGFSATKLDALGATEYTLVTIACDASSSVNSFKAELEKTLKEIVNSCKYSPRSDNLMIRLVQFGSQLHELHGFKLLESCNLDDYDGILQVGGMTALYDATENAVTSTSRYGKSLTENDFDANGIIFVLTDGMENHSTIGISSVVESFKDVYATEALESLITVLIGVGVDNPQISSYLTNFKDEAGFNQYVEAKNADSKTLAKLAEFVSKSISSQSQSLGTGGPSQNIPTSLGI
jgi:uncharacterized protein YegL